MGPALRARDPLVIRACTPVDDLTDPAEGRAWAVWLLDHEPAA